MSTQSSGYTNGAGAGTKLPSKAYGKDGKLDWNHLDVGIERSGTKITLPSDPEAMPIPEAIQALERKMADEEQIMAVAEVVDAYPLDGAVAFMMALKSKYGWASPIPTPGFFGKEPPKMLTVDIGPNPEDKIQVPWGRFMIPGIEKPVDTGTTRTEFGLSFQITGQLRKKEAHILKDLAELTRMIVKERSIYRGKAIRLRTDEDSNDLNPQIPPTFISTAHVKPAELVLPSSIRALVETNIFTLIKKTKLCMQHGIPLKRGVLMEGPYGCGKTMTASVTAKHAVDHGWTFIMLDRCQSLRQALEFAKRYEPCVIFAEDIDRATDSRHEKANDLLNILDGMLSKDSRIMVILTTNHVEKINQAMLRPGRLDAVISVTPPDSEAVQDLIRLYARGLLEDEGNLADVGKELAGCIPAFVREVVERSKLAMIARGGTQLAQSDLIVSAAGMKNHMALLSKPQAKDSDDPRWQLGNALAKIVATTSVGVTQMSQEVITAKVEKVANNLAGGLNDTEQRLSGGISAVKKDVGGVKGDTNVIKARVGG